MERVNEPPYIELRKQYLVWFNNENGVDFSCLIDEFKINLHLEEFKIDLRERQGLKLLSQPPEENQLLY